MEFGLNDRRKDEERMSLLRKRVEFCNIVSGRFHRCMLVKERMLRLCSERMNYKSDKPTNDAKFRNLKYRQEFGQTDEQARASESG